MRIIFVTSNFDVDDLELGYLHGWVDELAKHTKGIEVLCMRQGYHKLPAHVHVRSMGGEKKVGLISRTIRCIWHLLATVRKGDVVFIHGSPWFIVAGGWLWKLFRKPIGIWYEAGEVSPLLSATLPFVTFVFTSSSEGYHSGGDKKRIVGHGIDVHKFSPLSRPKHDGTFRIVTGGHISRAKDYGTLIRAFATLADSVDTPLKLSIVGAPKAGENEYAEEVRTLVRSYGLGEMVTFMGPMKNQDVVKLYRESDLFVSVYLKGQIEKSLAEATATGLPVVTSNRAFEDFAGEYDSFVFFPEGDDAVLAERLRHILTMSFEARHTLGLAFARIAVRDHSLDTLARSIVMAYRNG